MTRRAPPRPRPALTDRPSPLVDEAMAAWRAFRYDHALLIYERALRDEPDNLRVLVNAARCFGKRYDLPRAQRLLADLTDRAGGDPRVHHLVGETCRLLGLVEGAIEAFGRAVAAPNAPPSSWVQLATALEQAGDLDEADAAIARATSAAPADAWAALIRARVDARRGRTGDAVETLTRIGDAPGVLDAVACEALSDLAILHDRAGAWSIAADVITRAKARQMPAARALERPAALLRDRSERLIADVAARWPRTRAPGAPDTRVGVAMLVGFPRSGTTLLERAIEGHPGVAGVEERDVLGEVIFHEIVRDADPAAPVLDVLEALRAPAARRLAQRYRTLLGHWAHGPAPGRTLLDKNPGATLLTPVLRRLLPAAPIVVALRDPRDVVLSCFMRYFKENTWTVDFLTPLAAAQRYAHEIGGWMRLRDAVGGPFVEVRYEDVLADLPGQTARVLETLGLPAHEGATTHVGGSRSRVVLSPTYADVAKPLYTSSVGRWRRYEALLAPALPVLEPYVKAFGYA